MLQKKILATAIALCLCSGAAIAGKDKDLPNGQPFQNIQTQLDTHQVMLDAHAAVLAAHSTRLGTLEAITTDILGEVGSISAQLADHEARLSANEGAIADLVADIDAVRGDVFANQNTLISLVTDLGNLQGDVDELKSDIDDEISAVLSLIAQDKAELLQLLASLETQVNTNTSDISTLRTDINALSLSIQAQIFDLNLLIEQVRSEIPSDADIETLVVTNSVITSLLADVSSLSSAQSALQQQLNNLSINFDTEIADLRELIASLGNGGSSGISDLQGFLNRLLANQTSIIANVPANFVFNYDGPTYGGANCGIYDGGRDMYDYGNSLNTNILGSNPNNRTAPPCLSYTGSTIAEMSTDGSGDRPFGPSSSYFTTELPGLFVAAANDIEISEFSITGNNGADGRGFTSTSVLSTTVNGNEFTIYAKLVSDGGSYDPTINQLIVVPGDGANITHNYATNTDDSYQGIAGSGVQDLDSLIYILTATWNPATILSDSAIVDLVDSVLAQL